MTTLRTQRGQSNCSAYTCDHCEPWTATSCRSVTAARNLMQIEKSLPATEVLIDLLNRAPPIIDRRTACTLKPNRYRSAKNEWQTVGPAAQILIEVISPHVNRGRSPEAAAETVRAAFGGSIESRPRWLDGSANELRNRFGGTGFAGRRVVRHVRESGTKVRVVSRHRGRARKMASNRSSTTNMTNAAWRPPSTVATALSKDQSHVQHGMIRLPRCT